IDEAIVHIKQAISVKPDFAWAGRAYAHLGFILCNIKGDYKGAVDAFTSQIRLMPRDAMAHDHLGVALSRRRKYADAIEAFKTALRLKRDFPHALGHLGGLLCDMKKDYTGAVDAFQGQIQITPNDAVAHHNLGIALAHLGRYDDAVKSYERAILLQKDWAGVRYSLAWLLATCPDVRKRDPGRALEMARKAVELDPKHGGYWNVLGVSHYRAGNWKDAVAALQKSGELTRGGACSDWLFLAMAHWQVGDRGQAQKWYDKAVRWMENNHPQDL